MKNNYQDDPREKEAEQQRHFNIRLNLFFFSAFAIFTVIIVRLAILQFVEGPSLIKQGGNLAVKDIPLPPTRGTIYDRKNIKLAYSTPVQSLYMTLTKEYTGKNEANARVLAERLVERFNELGDPGGEKLTVDQVVEAMDLKSRLSGGFTPRRLKVGLSNKEIAYFMEHKAEYPGIDVVEESIRNYYTNPNDGVKGLAVQAVGYIKKFKGASTSLDFYKQKTGLADDPALQYTDTEDVGFDGLEYQYQDELRGRNGFKSVSVDPRNMASGIAEVTPPEKGHDIYLNIDSDVQLTAQKAIMEQLSWLHTHPVSGRYHKYAKTGFAVAMEVDTGNVVAMASMPDYDPNVWRTGGISSDNYDKIKNVYQNGTIRSFGSGQKEGQHPESVVLLGSTIKPLSVLVGLKEGLFTTSTPYYDKGYAYFGKNDSSRIQNSQGHVYGYLNSPADAIRHSSNTFMVEMIGERLYKKYGEKGIDKWDEYMKQFGLGVSTGVDLPNEYLGLREYTNEKETALSRLVFSSFGQQGKYTAMQLAQYTTMLATRGKRMEPHLVNMIKDADGNIVKKFEPKVLNEVKFKNSHWNEILKGMATEVSVFKDFPYDFARKTGTSTQSVGGKLVDNGVFIAFAPRNNPKLAVAVVVPEGGFGAQSAAPIARKIFDAYDMEYGLDGVPKKTLKKNEEKAADADGQTTGTTR
ncbi:penicillin-binding transpeptidase domain-containing protein [Paenibacillus sp. YPG26]|uniref:peptidoglycan D,D-transpeptidase FtsI family protein n=1 Tax=Paenibacillus sp. YPG26 TaxID=2878915 RepID=UPI00203BD8AF|nr:penicillin-binding transpeptidase domain-containing protein [Paenibacillus sp. YPG26]USB32557.1 penicillin-binding protein 2 [Paenibacillus sp. YPG26]